MHTGNHGPDAATLLQLHTEALFKFDNNGRMFAANEPWPNPGPAPRFYLGRSAAGTNICRYGQNVPDALIAQLETLCKDDHTTGDLTLKPIHFDAYMQLLQAEKYSMGPAFLVPETVTPSAKTVVVTRENAGILQDCFKGYAADIDYSQPCAALLIDNKAVSICCSVRITPDAHEAGIDTAAPYRGRGYALEVLAGWAAQVRKLGSLPLYSTSWDNQASQSVAKKSGLIFYGSELSIE